MSEHKKHHMNMHQIVESVFDFDKRSVKVHQDDVSHELSLSAASDSVVAVIPQMLLPQGSPQDCRMFKRVGIFSSSDCEIMIAPAPGMPLVSLIKLQGAQNMHIIDICCGLIQINGPADACLVLQG